jgi:peptidoglycan-associated lipoprotein
MMARWLLCGAVALTALSGCTQDPVDKRAATGDGAALSGSIVRSGPVAPEVGFAEIGDRVLFDTDSATIAAQYQGTVEALATWMRNHPATRLAIEGHADERGTREYNLALGDRRAIALRSALFDRGVAQTQIVSVVSYGKERPEAAGSTEAAWAQNRRAVLIEQ